MDQRLFHLIGGTTFAVCSGLAVLQWRGDVVTSAAGVIAVMFVCGVGCLGHLRRLADTQAVAEVVQRALLRPLPARLGPLESRPGISPPPRRRRSVVTSTTRSGRRTASGS